VTESQETARVPLYRIAHSRSGDKADRSNVAIIPYREEDYDLLAERLTAEMVKDYFGDAVKGAAVRYDLPKLKVFNFVLESALDGGVNDSLASDMHGKNRGMILLCMEIDVPKDHWSVAETDPASSG
jgi:hypothetical protein